MLYPECYTARVPERLKLLLIYRAGHTQHRVISFWARRVRIPTLRILTILYRPDPSFVQIG